MNTIQFSLYDTFKAVNLRLSCYQLCIMTILNFFARIKSMILFSTLNPFTYIYLLKDYFSCYSIFFLNSIKTSHLAYIWVRNMGLMLGPYLVPSERYSIMFHILYIYLNKIKVVAPSALRSTVLNCNNLNYNHKCQNTFGSSFQTDNINKFIHNEYYIYDIYKEDCMYIMIIHTKSQIYF